ncbi:cupin domain-containing protein [Halorubrum sp. PV6]|jgi:quercetin dioxygenase-like cupin family protein|uniref:cupin domain-containing protein n=1 Tax=Halorubrum sp. PV6 TaxID=634157 RepID=UPI000F850F0F|nr:cupin domain-containing protein [Halorubrum sp. PV6]AZQ14758.1 cupin [Halorubrum sp. PV6]
MTLDTYPAVDDLDPDPGVVETAELVVTDDVLVKAFVLGPDAAVDPHEHGDATNVFHVLEGEPTVVRGDDEESLAAPAVVLNERGTVHGARNDTDERAVITASLCPLP